MATTKKDQPTGWVIKNAEKEYLWVTPEGAFDWTPHPKWALRMARKQDAQMLAVADKNVGEVGRQRAIEEALPEGPDDAQELEVAKKYGREEKA